MKKLISITVLLVLALGMIKAEERYSVKANFIAGYVVPSEAWQGYKHNATLGGELDFEMNLNKYKWEKHWWNPTIGVGLVGMDLGNDKSYGQVFAAYPYVMWNFEDSKYASVGIKLGAGLAALTANNFQSHPVGIGSYCAGYLNWAINAKFNIIPEFSINLQAGMNHINNGEYILPNSTLNIVYGSVGFAYNFNSKKPSQELKFTEKEPYKTRLNIYFAGGAYNYYSNDPTKDQKTAAMTNIHIDGMWKITNCYSTGVGADIFYDGGLNTNNSKYNKFTQTSGEKINIGTPIKLGVVWANALTMGRVTGIIDMGVYAYDPLMSAVSKRNKENGNNKNYFQENTEHWMYMRGGLRCRLVDNLFAQVSVKTHVTNIESLEFGIGYTIPLGNKNKKNDLIDNITVKDDNYTSKKEDRYKSRYLYKRK